MLGQDRAAVFLRHGSRLIKAHACWRRGRIGNFTGRFLYQVKGT